MGNVQYCEHMPSSNVNDLKYQLNETKKQLIAIAKAPVRRFKDSNISRIHYEKFFTFHQNTLPELILEHKFKSSQPVLRMEGYVDMIHSVKEEGNSNESIMNWIKQEIEADTNCIILVILYAYNFFLEEFIQKKLRVSNIGRIKSKSSAHNDHFKQQQIAKTFIYKTQSIEEDPGSYLYEVDNKTLFSLCENESEMSQMIIYSSVTLFELIKVAIKQEYSEILNQMKRTVDNYLDNELHFQRVVQNLVYDKRFMIGNTLDTSIQHYYSNSTGALEQIDFDISEKLDEDLKPMEGSRFVARGLMLESEYEVIECKNNLRTSEAQSEMRYQRELKDCIQEADKQKLPYHQLLHFIEKMVVERKPYRVYQQIMKLDQAIVQLFLDQRPMESLDRYRDIISAEDNKLQILIFLLYMFQKQTKCDYKTKLYYKLKFMYDFDAVLDKDVKYLFDQSFMRFYNCLEMIMNSPMLS